MNRARAQLRQGGLMHARAVALVTRKGVAVIQVVQLGQKGIATDLGQDRSSGDAERDRIAEVQAFLRQWHGGAQIDGQTVARSDRLKDGDVVELHV